jgi:hypothetical protein
MILITANETAEIILAADHPGNGKRRACRDTAYESRLESAPEGSHARKPAFYEAKNQQCDERQHD